MDRREMEAFLDSEPSIQDLRRYAKMLGLRLKRRMKKREIVKLIRNGAKDMPSSSESSVVGPIEEPVYPSKPDSFPLPDSYGRDKLMLMPINPKWMHLCWDFSKETLEKISQSGKDLVLRIHDVTSIIFSGSTSNKTKVINIAYGAMDWYLDVEASDADYIAELGYFNDDYVFVPLIRSNVARTPADYPKFAETETWLDLKKKRREARPVSEAFMSDAIRASSSARMGNPSSEEYLNYLAKSASGGGRR
ncbi:MAG TPA: DUF4912 domain-containing protein [Kosmotogaceae bacterium]|nr:MAG: Uncharacterized protein XE05_0484 [Thermotogales bacterium 46_20]HAA86495.1 DUF4912 domain-containing protein [Kosmotogaceae bacterium]